MGFIAGGYSWSYGGSDLGVMQDAPQFRHVISGEVVRGDNLGDVIQGWINRGGPMYVSMVFQEFNAAGAQKAFWPFSSQVGRMPTGAAEETGGSPIGCPVTPQVLIGDAGVWGCASPNYYHFYKAVLAPNSDVSYLRGNRLTNVPVTMLIIPTIVNGHLQFYHSTRPN